MVPCDFDNTNGMHRLLQADPGSGIHESRVEEALQLLQRRSEAVKPPSLSWKDHELQARMPATTLAARADADRRLRRRGGFRNRRRRGSLAG